MWLRFSIFLKLCYHIRCFPDLFSVRIVGNRSKTRCRKYSACISFFYPRYHLKEVCKNRQSIFCYRRYVFYFSVRPLTNFSDTHYSKTANTCLMTNKISLQKNNVFKIKSESSHLYIILLTWSCKLYNHYTLRHYLYTRTLAQRSTWCKTSVFSLFSSVSAFLIVFIPGLTKRTAVFSKREQFYSKQTNYQSFYVDSNRRLDWTEKRTHIATV